MKESEADFQRWVIDLAHAYGWLVHHDRAVKLPSGRYGTPIQGDAGFPDLVLARLGQVLFVELKAQGRYLEPAQKVWIDALPSAAVVPVYLWRPSDRVEIEKVLR